MRSSSLLADAEVRRSQFEHLIRPLNHELERLLFYKQVAIEDTHWHNLGPSVVEAMHLTGATSVLDWLTRLGRLSGTRVQPVSPWNTSRHCGQCGQEGQLANDRFLCPVCPPVHRDLNAAAFIRRRVLGKP